MTRARLLWLLALGSILSSHCYHESDYTSPTDPSHAFLTLSTSASPSIPADGVSRITIVARITPLADNSTRTVAFETTAGTFVGAAATSREVIANAAGEATVELQSSQLTETATVTAKVKDVPAVLPARITVSFTAVNPESIVRFTSIPASAPADGSTVSTIVVQVTSASNLPTTSRTVTFQTTAGMFLPDNGTSSTTTADATGMARALLRSPSSVTTARVRVIFNNSVNDGFVRFDAALPESLSIASDKFAVQPTFNDIAKIDVQLRRQTGVATPGAEIVLSATDDHGNSIGTFTNTTLLSDVSGHAVTNFTAGTTSYAGPVTITAAVKGTDVRGSATIRVIATPPKAVFESTIAGKQVNFVDQSTGTPTSWLWAFGDGSSSTAKNPTHVYASGGAYTVTLSVMNAGGSDSVSHVVTIAP